VAGLVPATHVFAPTGISIERRGCPGQARAGGFWWKWNPAFAETPAADREIPEL